jgi:hypothetical protein
VTVRDHEFPRSDDSRLRRESPTRVIGRDHVPEVGSRDRWPGIQGDGSSRHGVHQDSHEAVADADTLVQCRTWCKALTTRRAVLVKRSHIGKSGRSVKRRRRRLLVGCSHTP